MQNLFKPNIPNDTDKSQQISVNQINADNYANYFILPRTNGKNPNTKSARENILIADKQNENNSLSLIKSKEAPIKPSYNNDFDTIFERSSHRKSSSKNKKSENLIERDDNSSIQPMNNMFINYTNDIVSKKNTLKSKYNLLDCRIRKHSMNEENNKLNEDSKQIIEDIGKVFNYKGSIDHLYERVKVSYKRAVEVDQCIHDILLIYKDKFKVQNQIDYNHVGTWIQKAHIRNELYAQLIELNRALCEELIRQTHINQLEEISIFANSIANSNLGENNLDYNHNSENFIRSVNAMIRNKYIASERIEDANDNISLNQRKVNIGKY